MVMETTGEITSAVVPKKEQLILRFFLTRNSLLLGMGPFYPSGGTCQDTESQVDIVDYATTAAKVAKYL